MPVPCHASRSSVFLMAALGCAALLVASPAAAKKNRDPSALGWRRIATQADRDRIRSWRDTWITALAQANHTAPAKVAAEGVLLAPDAAQSGPLPPPGDYRCRVIKLGAQGAAPAYATYPPFQCRVDQEGDVRGFAKLTGSQRPTGLLLPDGGTRAMFLGTMMLGDERRALDYGSDPDRDVIGFVERIGPRRWRLAMPQPRWESLLDVIELVPGD